MKNKKKILSIILLLSLIISLFVPLTVHAEEKYELNGLWKYRSKTFLNPGATKAVSQDINFTTTDYTIEYKRITITPDSVIFTRTDGRDIVVAGERSDGRFQFLDFFADGLDAHEVWGSSFTKIRFSDYQEVSKEFWSLFTKIFISNAEYENLLSENIYNNLSRDSTFDFDDYDKDSNDYSLDIIQVAEDDDGDLHVYVYRPIAPYEDDYYAESINMCIKDPADHSPSYKIYDLDHVATYDCVDEYVVEDFEVSDDKYRYYNIAAIYRDYDSSVDDEKVSVDGTASKAFTVGKTWCAYYDGDELVYEMQKLDVVVIDITASGNIRYSDGFKLTYLDKCDSHYVAFSIKNYDVDRIYDADITFTVKEYVYNRNMLGQETVTEKSSETLPLTLSENDTGSNSGKPPFGKKYTWNRICTVEDFIKEVNDDMNDGLSDSEMEGLEQAEFVFRFIETEYESVTINGATSSQYSEIKDFKILRLHFLSEGKTYNLGAVSDGVNVDHIPDGEVTPGDDVQNTVEDFQDWLARMEEEFDALMKIIGVIILVVVIIGLVVLLKPLFKDVSGGIVGVFSFIWSMITMPFQLLFSKNKGGKNKRE